MLDEVTGKQVQFQRRWTPADGAHVPFSHMIVGNETSTLGIGSCYAVGTLQECRVMQLTRGWRAHTQVIPF